VWASTAEEPQFDSEARSRDLDKRISREIYGGFRRNNNRAGLYVIQSEYDEGPERVVDYEDPEEHNKHYVYVQGP